jgi:hypothetical protein
MAWAVGETGSGDGPTKTLTLRWDGTAWRKVPAPSPGASASLNNRHPAMERHYLELSG